MAGHPSETSDLIASNNIPLMFFSTVMAYGPLPKELFYKCAYSNLHVGLFDRDGLNCSSHFSNRFYLLGKYDVSLGSGALYQKKDYKDGRRRLPKENSNNKSNEGLTKCLILVPDKDVLISWNQI